MNRYRVVYDFYLCCRLPQLPQGDPLQIDVIVSGRYTAQAKVIARHREEDLFRDEPGYSISTARAEIRSVVDKHVVRVVTAESLGVVDRLTIQLDFVQRDHAIPDPDQWRPRAVKLAEDFMQHLRIAARDASLSLGRIWSPHADNIEHLWPRAESWFASETLEPFQMFGENNCLTSMGAVLIPHPRVIDEDTLKTTLPEGDPPLAEKLLVDAERDILDLDLRGAILNMASAVEVSGHALKNAARAPSRRRLEEIVTPSGGRSFALRFLHELPLAIAERSFRDEGAEEYERVDAMYRTRNNLMHDGEFSELFSVKEELQRVRLAWQWLQASRLGVTWLRSI